MRIGGAPLPKITSLKQFKAFDAKITDVGASNGAFAPNTLIKFRDLPFDAKTEHDLIVGTGRKDELSGGAGDDTIFGAGNDDLMVGGSGDDEFFGENGSDTIKGGAGFDEADYSNSKNAITADWKKGTVKDGTGSTDKISGIELIRGTKQADTFQGNSADNSMRGLKGDDTIKGGGGTDTVRYDKDAAHGGSAGVSIDLNKNVATDGFGDIDTLSSIENAIGSQGSDAIVGSDVANRIRGANGKDTIFGLEGDDSLMGERGRDQIDGGDGRDTIEGGDGNDILIGGNDPDRFVFNNGFGSDTITDFNALSDAEKINLRGVGSIKAFRDLKKNHMTKDGPDVVIDDGNGNTIRLLDVKLGDLDAADFLF